MKRWTGTRIWESGSEIIGTIFRVLFFYGLFMLILIYSFPSGTGLGDLYQDLVLDRVEGSSLDIGEGPVEDLGPLASISKISRRVTDRAAHEVAWKSSRVGKDILDRHAIQTQSRSTAEISFGENDTLKLGEKSLVVIRRPNRGRAKSRRPSLLILGGNVHGVVSAGDAEPMTIETGAVTASVRSTSAEPADFQVIANPDESSTVEVFSGEAEVTAEGRTEVVGPMQAVTVAPGEAPSAPVKIPEPPRNLSPPEGTVVTSGENAPRVRFGWSGEPDIETYRIVIARDPGFEEIVHEETLTGDEVDHGRLRPGAYFWRVTGTRDRAVSPPSETRRLSIERDLEAPELLVELPSGTVESESLTIVGLSEPDALVSMGQRQLSVGETGKFEFTIRLKQGPNLIALRAVDAAGNVAYHSQYVLAEF